MNKPSKALTPLQAMTRVANEELRPEESTEVEITGASGMKIIEVLPNSVRNWKFHDRPEMELGDIAALAQEFKEVGQQQPCIVRALKNEVQYQYEIIAGERRWRASLLAKTKLKVIVKELSDNEAALVQITENSNRKDLSDYAKGMSYAQLIDNGIIQQKDLVEKLGKPKQYISSLLSFSKIPEEVMDAISDMTLVSCRSAEQIRRLSSKGESYVKALISIADKIRSGKYGQERIEKYVLCYVNSEQQEIKPKSITKAIDRTGRHLFTWRNDINDCPSIHFPKDMSKFIRDHKSNLTDDILKMIENYIRDP